MFYKIILWSLYFICESAVKKGSFKKVVEFDHLPDKAMVLEAWYEKEPEKEV